MILSVLDISRPNLFEISHLELYIHYAATIVIAALFIYWFYLLYRKLGLDRKSFVELIRKWNWRNLFLYGIFQRKVVKDYYAGTMHVLISWGIIFLTISTALVALDNDILAPFGIRILVGSFYLAFEVFSDTGGLMLLVGLTMALYRRLRKKVLLHTVWDDYIVIGALYLIAFEGFFLEGLNIYLLNTLQNFSYVDQYRYLGSLFSIFWYNIFGNNTIDAIIAYRVLWEIHFLTVFIVLGYALLSKLSHVILSPLYVTLRDQKVRGEMSTPFKLEELLASGSFDIKMGIEKPSDLKPIQRLETLACTDCGRCERACPAFAAGRELSPRVLMQTLKSNVGDSREFVPAMFSEDFIWSCTTCQACVEECPVTIDPQNYLLEMRRDLVFKSRIDKQKVQFLNNLTYTRNPLGNSPSERNIWIEKSKKFENDEYLLWIGCMASFDPRTKNVAESLIKILKEANVSFGVLGEEESCCGDSARRLGEESRYQELVMQNVSVFKAYNVKKIITICPHGYNTFRNEYSRFIEGLEVYHHTQIIEKLIREGKISMDRREINFTYHDPCYLGRINGEYDAPRFILSKAVNLVEMERSRSRSFCCGGGGANYWYKVNEKEPISQIRIKEAEGKSRNVAVACPFCLGMLEDAARTLGKEDMNIRDIAEIVASGIQRNSSESGSSGSR
ncbi:MAG: heterodisulfide reductase-related iron-sulfur binding cluster [Thermoplasmata archaeon]